jgi:hypothetical protein
MHVPLFLFLSLSFSLSLSLSFSLYLSVSLSLSLFLSISISLALLLFYNTMAPTNGSTSATAPLHHNGSHLRNCGDTHLVKLPISTGWQSSLFISARNSRKFLSNSVLSSALNSGSSKIWA